MNWSTVLRGIDEVLASDLGRADKAVRVAALIREAGRYRWVGLYAVADQEITVIGWSGPGGACASALSGVPRALYEEGPDGKGGLVGLWR